MSSAQPPNARRPRTRRGGRKRQMRKAPLLPKDTLSRGASSLPYLVPMGSTFSPQRVMPDQLDVRLTYLNKNVFTNGVSPIASKEWYSNAAFDVDPALGSTETPGFDEYAALYHYYRVIGFRYRVVFSNLESMAVAAYVFNTNSTVTGTNYDLISALPYCKRYLLAPVGSGESTRSVSGYVSFAKLLGGIDIETAVDFRSSTSAVPADKFHFTLAVERLSGISFTTGVAYTISVEMDVRFYDRDWDLSLSSQKRAMRVLEIQSARELYRAQLRAENASLVGKRPAPPQ